jgi:hypothetical protein
MTLATVAFGLVVLALLVLLLSLSHHQRRITPRLPPRPLKPALDEQLSKLQASDRYRGVRIESRCSASEALAGREFDFDTAPTLPVPDCSTAVCECQYIGLPERRKAADRRSWAERRKSERPGHTDRRAKHPRRKADIAIWAARGRL